MPKLKTKPFRPTPQAEKDTNVFDLAGGLAQAAAHALAALVQGVAEARPLPGNRTLIRGVITEFYLTILGELDCELDGDDVKWRALLRKGLDRRQDPAAWTQRREEGDRTGGVRFNSGAIDAYLAGDLDDKEARP